MTEKHIFGKKISERQLYAIVFAVEAVLIIAAVCLCLTPEKEYAFVGQELETAYGIYLEDFLGEYGDGYYLDSSIHPEEAAADAEEELEYLTIASPKTDLSRGTYEVTIQYAANDNLNTYTARAEYNTYQIIYGKQHIGLNDRETSAVVWMYSPIRIKDFQMNVRFGGSGYLLVNSIIIRETKDWKYVSLTIILFFSALLDGCLWWRAKRRRGPGDGNGGAGADNGRADASAKAVLFLGILLIVFSAAPVFSFYLQGEGDLDFHLARIEAIRQGLLAGQFPVRLSGYWCDGYGYAASIFYGELFLYVPAVLRLIGFSPQSAYKIYLLGVNTATFLLTYYCLYRMCKERLSAFMGTAVYMLAPYRLITLHVFGGVGMYTSMTFLPVVIYGLYLIYAEEAGTENGGKDRNARGWLWLALGFTGLLQCHVISTFIAALFTFFFCVAKLKKTLQKKTLLQLVAAVASAVLWNLWFLLPFMDYMRFDYRMSETGLHSRGRFAANGTFFSQLISFFPHAEGPSISAGMEIGIDTPGVELSYTLGGGMMLALILYVVYRIYRGRQEEGKDALIWKMAGIQMGFCILALVMTTLWFPWDFLQQRSDLIAWVTGSIQFPWRFLNIASVTGAFLVAFLVYEMRRNVRPEFFYGAVLAIGLLTLLSADYFLQDMEKTAVERYITEAEVDSWNLIMGEYFPSGIDETTFERDQLQHNDALAIEEYERGQGAVAVTCENIGSDETFVDVPILYYKGYVARDAGNGEKLNVIAADNKRVRVIIPTGYQGSFSVRFESPWYWRVSEIISLLSVAACVAIFVRRRAVKV